LLSIAQSLERSAQISGSIGPKNDADELNGLKSVAYGGDSVGRKRLDGSVLMQAVTCTSVHMLNYIQA